MAERRLHWQPKVCVSASPAPTRCLAASDHDQLALSTAECVALMLPGRNHAAVLLSRDDVAADRHLDPAASFRTSSWGPPLDYKAPEYAANRSKRCALCVSIGDVCAVYLPPHVSSFDAWECVADVSSMLGGDDARPTVLSSDWSDVIDGERTLLAVGGPSVLAAVLVGAGAEPAVGLRLPAPVTVTAVHFGKRGAAAVGSLIPLFCGDNDGTVTHWPLRLRAGSTLEAMAGIRVRAPDSSPICALSSTPAATGGTARVLVVGSGITVVGYITDDSSQQAAHDAESGLGALFMRAHRQKVSDVLCLPTSWYSTSVDGTITSGREHAHLVARADGSIAVADGSGGEELVSIPRVLLEVGAAEGADWHMGTYEELKARRSGGGGVLGVCAPPSAAVAGIGSLVVCFAQEAFHRASSGAPTVGTTTEIHLAVASSTSADFAGDLPALARRRAPGAPLRAAGLALSVLEPHVLITRLGALEASVGDELSSAERARLQQVLYALIVETRRCLPNLEPLSELALRCQRSLVRLQASSLCSNGPAADVLAALDLAYGGADAVATRANEECPYCSARVSASSAHNPLLGRCDANRCTIERCWCSLHVLGFERHWECMGCGAKARASHDAEEPRDQGVLRVAAQHVGVCGMCGTICRLVDV